jgi:ubiquinone biosynthesis accessory factor UbiK
MATNPFEQLQSTMATMAQQAQAALKNSAPFTEMEKSVKAAAQAQMAKLDLVTREEFETQRAVLAKTRAMVEALEARVATLEGKQPQP